MGYKVGFVLSLLLVVELFVLAADILSAQIIYTNLDAVSVTAGQIISSKGEISEELKEYVRDQTGGEISPVGEELPLFGSIYTFQIVRDYKPINWFVKESQIVVVRSVIIGYYN